MRFQPNKLAPTQVPSKPAGDTTAAGGGFLRRLARNTAGNTLVIMGMAVIPLAGLVGGAVDVSRLYLTKTRL